MGSVVCAASAPVLESLFERRGVPKACPKSAAPLLQLLQRTTSPGQRGWDSVLSAALKTEGTTGVVGHAVHVCVTGLHPQLHPAVRPGWRERLGSVRLLEAALRSPEAAAMLSRCAAPVKEAMRRCIASIMATTPAAHAALASLGHPVRQLLEPPSALPRAGMEAAMGAFVRAGQTALVALSGVEGDSGARAATRALGAAIERAFAAQAHSAPAHPPRFDPSWMGKGSTNVRPRVAAVTVAGDVWAAAFRANFLPFWTFGMSRQLRISRLDAAQHDALHSMNAATRLCAELTEGEQLAAQRAALRDVSAGVLTLEEVALRLLGRRIASAAPPRTVADAVYALGGGDPRATARLLAYARAAWVREHVLVVELGEAAVRQQERALLRRHGGADVASLPAHATHVVYCCECHRIASAHACDPPGGAPCGGDGGPAAQAASATAAAFNELGCAASMTAIDPETGVRDLRCAKRSSAALRAAITFEEDMTRRCVECEAVDASAVREALSVRVSGGIESGIAARLRRDARSALEQHRTAVPCGASPMLLVRVLGRVVRLNNEWLALCAYCACVTRVQPHTRYGDAICCMRCDPKMVHSAAELATAAPGVAPNGSAAGASARKLCRYCGRQDPEKSGARWKTVAAPLDASPSNEPLPPPLRAVHYCPTHWKPWLEDAHRVFKTSVIFAHINMNARPVYGSAQCAEVGVAGRTCAGLSTVPDNDSEDENAPQLKPPPASKRHKTGGGGSGGGGGGAGREAKASKASKPRVARRSRASKAPVRRQWVNPTQ
jgi:hypothetical protein